MIYVEIELNGVVTAKRCTRVLDGQGLICLKSIRDYFTSLGYEVGHIRLC